MKEQQEIPSLKIALIQMPIIWQNPEANRRLVTEKLTKCTHDIDVIILPEMFTTGFTMQPESIAAEESTITLAWMQQKAAEKNAAIVGSIVFCQGSTYFNRLFFVRPSGLYDFYDKRHTFTLAGEHVSYASGKDRCIVFYKGFTFCPLICYDLRFPVWSRNTDNYDVLVYVANWPSPRINAWDALLKARAIENLSYCIGVNRVGEDPEGHKYPGHSAAYDALGNQLIQATKEEILFVEVSKNHLLEIREKFNFLEDRDSFSLLD